MENKELAVARTVAEAVAAAGGCTYFVGGYVRDLLRGQQTKDIDIEVHGIMPRQLERILDGIGERTVMGASFGIYGLKHCELDIAMPRQEKTTGRGHRDFEVLVDPFLGPYKAALRRDFTINAMMQDVLTGEIMDPCGGQRDLRDGILRHVNAQTFAEDPLRVLRGAQFAARFGFDIEAETVALCARMDLTALAHERIWGELEKALLKAARPSAFFAQLRRMDQLSFWFPEVEALIGIPQDPRFHPEGDVWNHTMSVLDAAAALRERAENPLGLMLAALCHDFGKVSATQRMPDGRIRALGHERAGLAPAKALLHRLCGEIRLEKYVLNMVELHMRPNLCAGQNSSQKGMNRLYDAAVSPEDLLLLAEADRMGQGRTQDYAPTRQFLRTALAQYREMMARPFVRGADLVALGYRPGPEFRAVLEETHKLRLAGISKEEALRHAVSWLEKAARKTRGTELRTGDSGQPTASGRSENDLLNKDVQDHESIKDSIERKAYGE